MLRDCSGDTGGVASAFGPSGGAVALALTTGVITAFNPCGFAMLPAYLSYFVGATANDETPTTASRVARAGIVGSTVTLGFVTVFGILGLLANELRSTIQKSSAYVALTTGVILFVLGVAMLRGFEPKVSFLKVKSVKKGSSLRAMYLFGVSYAVVSLSCGIQGFLTTVASAFRTDSLIDAGKVYAAFSIGMGLVVLVVSIAAALAQQAFLKAMRKVLPYINRISGVLLLLTGIYITWFGWIEYRSIVQDGSANDAVTERGYSVSSWFQNRLTDVSTAALTTVAVVIAVVVGASIWASRRPIRAAAKPTTRLPTTTEGAE